jgi:hypothetical protein
MPPPMLTKEQFERAIQEGKHIYVWVQICPWLQQTLEITSGQAKQLTQEVFDNDRAVWGMIREDVNEIELSITSQWYDRYLNGENK